MNKAMSSWVAGANAADTDFSLNNLPYGVFSTHGQAPRCGVAIGDMILDVAQAEMAGLTGTQDLLQQAVWNPLMKAGPKVWAAFRARLIGLLKEGSAHVEDLTPMLVPMSDAAMHMPFRVAEYTDFYAGKQHAQNVGTMFRGPENALPPNWLHIPIGYNGRASTVVVSGTDIRRPVGQTKAKDAANPVFGPSQRLDIELEIGAIVGTPSDMGQPVTVAQAREMIFGYVLLNDWSARDLQAWEYQPLGPFQAKAFATSISPWIVTAAALAPFAAPAPDREVPLLPYLVEDTPGLYDIDLFVHMNGHQISHTNMQELYYSSAQQLAHHASSGCAMRSGDLLGSGTISGPKPDNYGSLLEMTWGGQNPITLGDQTRRFIEDGDRLTLTGHAQGDGYRVGFGACTGTILPAPDFYKETT
ncbi:fumarylacetoacetate hydrolase [Yoonia sediminilitoris]|uniref:fumarylacetoacetase n=2 Tax=Yoonia sediminilitoris TaxID=1286148 RepID=A0A2T6KBW0_9RHOB|nr:fumarylacetoacetate hydrolase [Yoonia sediminilitoris]RCW93095.1 fumarylacetoacetate hydrolase [Yoonia sediminilitoris]